MRSACTLARSSGVGALCTGSAMRAMASTPASTARTARGVPAHAARPAAERHGRGVNARPPQRAARLARGARELHVGDAAQLHSERGRCGAASAPVTSTTQRCTRDGARHASGAGSVGDEHGIDVAHVPGGSRVRHGVLPRPRARHRA